MRKLCNQCQRAVLWALSAALLFSTAPWAAAADMGPGYYAEGVWSSAEGTVSVSIYAERVRAVAGRFALGYDPQILTPHGGTQPFQAGPGVVQSSEGLHEDTLIQQGQLLLAWYPTGSRLDASKERKLVATVVFDVKPDRGEADFHLGTLFLADVKEGAVGEWRSGAMLMDEYGRLWECGGAGDLTAQVSFQYPNSKLPIPNGRRVHLQAADTQGAPLAAKALIEGKELALTPEQGAVLWLREGEYSYSLWTDGYERRTGHIAVAGNEVALTVPLRTDRELVDAVSKTLRIDYTQDESAETVRSDLGLRTQAEGGASISWTSSRPEVVNSQGGVFPRSGSGTVTLRAEISKGAALQRREFQIFVQPPPAEGSTNSKEVPKGAGVEHKPFSDLDTVPWAKEAILDLAGRGVLRGSGPDTFKPLDKLRRCDLAALLVRVLLPDGHGEGEPFSDVPAGAYYAPELSAARAAGIAQGGADGSFRPEEPVTRQGMAVLADRAMAAAGVRRSEDMGLAAFSDGAAVSGYARAAVGRTTACGLLQGSGGAFRPIDEVTRAEAAVFLQRLLRQTESE